MSFNINLHYKLRLLFHLARSWRSLTFGRSAWLFYLPALPTSKYGREKDKGNKTFFT